MAVPMGSDFTFLRALEGALRDGRLLDEQIGGILDAALQMFDAAAVGLLPAGGAPPMTRAGRSIVAAAAEQRLSRHLEDVLAQGRELRASDSGLTFAGVPVKAADQVRAAFGIAVGQLRGREAELNEAVRLFSQTVSHVLERDRTVSTLLKRREEAVALFELASGALHSLNADEVIRLTVASLHRELGLEQVQAFLYDADTREVEEIHSLAPSRSGGVGRVKTRRPIDEEEILVRCLSAHGPAFDDDPGNVSGPSPMRRRLALPLQAGDTVFGFLTMQRRGPFVLVPQEMRLAQELARLAAGAMEKARLIESERRTTERVAFVARLHAALAGLTEVEPILQRTVKEVGPHFDVDFCSIRIVGSGELPGASASYGKTGSTPHAPGEEIPDALLSHLSGEGSHVLLADAMADPRGLSLIPAPDVAKDLARPISLLAVPLSYRGAIVGVLAAMTGGQPRGFDEQVLRSFEAIAVEVSLAVTSARLFQKERDSYRFLDRLREVGRTLTTTFDAPRIKQVLCEQSVALLRADTAHYWDADPQSKGLQISARWGAEVGGDVGRTVPMEKAQHPVVRALMEKTLLVASENELVDLFPGAAPAAGPPLAKMAIVPLLYQDERIGVLSLGLRRGSTGWPPDLAGRLALLSDAGAVALHNARMMRIIEQQSERDAQTGLYNRQAVMRRLESELRRAERSGQPISVAHLKMEGLADSAQRFGPSVAEAFLPKAAAQLVRATRAVNVVGRDKNDRFWILIFDASKSQAHRAVETIQKNFDGAFDARLEQAGLKLSLTVGIAAYPEDAFDTSSLVLRAEEALDDAIKNGAGSIALYGALSEADQPV